MLLRVDRAHDVGVPPGARGGDQRGAVVLRRRLVLGDLVTGVVVPRSSEPERLVLRHHPRDGLVDASEGPLDPPVAVGADVEGRRGIAARQRGALLGADQPGRDEVGDHLLSSLDHLVVGPIGGGHARVRLGPVELHDLDGGVSFRHAPEPCDRAQFGRAGQRGVDDVRRGRARLVGIQVVAHHDVGDAETAQRGRECGRGPPLGQRVLDRVHQPERAGGRHRDLGARQPGRAAEDLDRLVDRAPPVLGGEAGPWQDEHGDRAGLRVEVVDRVPPRGRDALHASVGPQLARRGRLGRSADDDRDHSSEGEQGRSHPRRPEERGSARAAQAGRCSPWRRGRGSGAVGRAGRTCARCGAAPAPCSGRRATLRRTPSPPIRRCRASGRPVRGARRRPASVAPTGPVAPDRRAPGRPPGRS